MKKIFTLLLSCLLTVTVFGQNKKCQTHDHWKKRQIEDPAARIRNEKLEQFTANWIKNHDTNKGRAVITIPTVVHILYHDPIENVSDSQIISQMIVLNEDFREMNWDELPANHPFKQYSADCEIEFCLAQQDPNGNPTTGITRTYTDSTQFVDGGNEKFSSSGGKDNWDPTKYMNMWVCNLGTGGTLGYATFPSDLASDPNEDGIVIDYRAFGFMGTAGSPPFTVNYLGRTGTHEVGHWLNLRHIWGDANCGDDLVADTPPQQTSNGGCPLFPYNANNSCGSDANGEMYMNYMDYTDDSCMAMFSQGQKSRMLAAINGARSALLTSTGCNPPTNNVNDFSILESISISPNPSAGQFYLQNPNNINITKLSIYNSIGEVVLTIAQSNSQELNLLDLPKGVYYVQIKSGDQLHTQKIMKL
ncbi:MAG: M43 family zinc metalloprotease [Flavobacteriales bacterium]|nr:M43 family zinc metalloprotease [Flavobacteriales bacterium]